MNHHHLIQAMERIHEHNERIAKESSVIQRKYQYHISGDSACQILEGNSGILPEQQQAKVCMLILRDAADRKTGLLPLSSAELLASYARHLGSIPSVDMLEAQRHQLMFRSNIPGLCAKNTKHYKAVLVAQIQDASYARSNILRQRLHPFFQLLCADDAPVDREQAITMLAEASSWMARRICRTKRLSATATRVIFGCSYRTATWLSALYNKLPGTPLQFV